MRWFFEKLTDTLAKRLFLLMWGALVVSHALAFAAVLMAMPAHEYGPPWERMARIPITPSLPPTFRNGPERPRGEMRPPPRHEDANEGEEPPPPQQQQQFRRDRRPFSMPAYLVVLDYSVRLIVIALAAWFGSRWVTAPMRRLVKASQALGASVGQDRSSPELDEEEGPREIRQTARVFNTMARQLRQQFRTRGLMVAAISHDLRTPLTRLRMRLEVMDADPVLQAKSVGDVQEMNALIDKVLDVFRGEAQAEAMQKTDVVALLQSLVDDLAEQGLPVHFKGEGLGEVAITEVQPLALRRVLGNLIGNALRYGGRADVQVQLTADELLITVDDAGPGIPEAHLEDVFQPFFRLEGSRNQGTGGTGLGLYIARDLTQRQNGRLTLKNRPEGGLRAELVLPQR